jgi:DNA-binding CsgD family transcriptional regulator
LLEFFHGELGRLVGRQLVSATEPSPEELSPRLRQTLACLIDGDSEKQVAGRLGLSPTTVHQYVTMLYRRFGVRSRGQLLAHVLRRSERTNGLGPRQRLDEGEKSR